MEILLKKTKNFSTIYHLFFYILLSLVIEGIHKKAKFKKGKGRYR